MAVNGIYVPVEGFPGFQVRQIRAGLYMRIRAAAVEATQREIDPLEPEGATILAAALYAAYSADGERVWSTFEEVENDERVFLVDAVGQAAVSTLPEQPDEGN